MHVQLIAVQLSISGRVQGVGYRASMRAEAQALRLTGWVRNQRNGDVAAQVQGAPALVEAILAWCHRGPPGAQVRAVITQPCAVDAGLTTFSTLATPL